MGIWEAQNPYMLSLHVPFESADEVTLFCVTLET